MMHFYIYLKHPDVFYLEKKALRDFAGFAFSARWFWYILETCKASGITAIKLKRSAGLHTISTAFIDSIVTLFNGDSSLYGNMGGIGCIKEDMFDIIAFNGIYSGNNNNRLKWSKSVLHVKKL